jgi:ubiquinone/menaquinone biosynthesis C-methylase UbiE
MRCPKCSSSQLAQNLSGILCTSCKSRFPLRNGVLDMFEDDTKEVITPFQRLMQSSAIVSIYEKLWRRLGYFLASSRSFTKELQTVLMHGKDKDAARTLDLACGPGVFTRPLSRLRKGIVIGLDLSWPMLRHAQKMIEQEQLENVLLVRASAFGLPFADESFSYVNCCGALHLFDRPEAALLEIGRILVPGGHLCVQTTIRPNHSAGFTLFLEKFIRFGFFNEDELLEMLKRHGFYIEKSERHRISFTFLARRERTYLSHTPQL